MICFGDVYRGRRVLVTGHTGFKGSWLTLWLKHLGAEVAGFSSGVPTSPANFDLLDLGGQIKHYVGDIRDSVRLAQVIDEFRPEMVFHLAAQALVQSSYDDPVATFEINVMGMVNLLDCVRARPWIEVAVLITSDKAYRNVEWCWGYRETDALGGHDPYSGSKSCADLVAQSYFHSFLCYTSTRVAITRAGNVIGGGDWAANRIVPDCIRAWSRGEPVAARNPQATRPWEHVLEPLSGYLCLGAGLWRKLDGLNGEAFNFGPPVHVNQTVLDLLHAMAVRWPEAQVKVPESSRPGGREATLLKLSCDKVLARLNWLAVLQFHETVALTVDWYRAWHEGRHDLPAYTIAQIEYYCQLAHRKGGGWVQP